MTETTPSYDNDLFESGWDMGYKHGLEDMDPLPATDPEEWHAEDKSFRDGYRMGYHRARAVVENEQDAP